MDNLRQNSSMNPETEFFEDKNNDKSPEHQNGDPVMIEDIHGLAAEVTFVNNRLKEVRSKLVKLSRRTHQNYRISFIGSRSGEVGPIRWVSKKSFIEFITRTKPRFGIKVEIKPEDIDEELSKLEAIIRKYQLSPRRDIDLTIAMERENRDPNGIHLARAVMTWVNEDSYRNGHIHSDFDFRISPHISEEDLDSVGIKLSYLNQTTYQSVDFFIASDLRVVKVVRQAMMHPYREWYR